MTRDELNALEKLAGEAMCETCRWRGAYYLPEDHAIKGGDLTFKCRRHAPIITGGLHTPTATVWPWVRLKDWCGDHQPHREARATDPSPEAFKVWEPECRACEGDPDICDCGARP